ncbi:MAG: hypothetical protein PHE70_07530, partial [Tepidanaerobacteraceae bacterium]|nr:hypothetical protein [Tepidanaerobacteraceae bacterium]
VGPSVLYTTANYIADIIKKRYKNNITKPLTIIACENMKYASTSLYDNVKLLLTSTELTYCQEMVAFPDAEVSRMAMPIIDENPLTVKVEEYKEWIIDKKNLKSDLSDIKDLELTDNPAAFINRKIYTLTGHAMVGYLGFQKGYTYIYEAAYDDEIFKKVTGALMESGRGWAREYGMLEEDFFEYSSVMLRRFADIRLKDPIHRVCREPLRKLSPRERFIQPAITAIKYGILPYSIIDGIKSVFEYKNNDDEQTVSMCKIIKNMGKGEILTDICGLERESVLYNLIIN